ncbi:MAG: hypothetical protein GWP15_00510 [Nitrospirae bacterium]|nr:hypothetical protein [Nitrospirota bacterium]
MKLSIKFFSTALPILLGVVYALSIFDFGYILGQNDYWMHPFGDMTTHLIGAMYYVQSHWQFPLFFTPELAFPEGTNIIFTDSLPILALIAKVIFKISGEWFNYFGLWVFLCFPLLAFFIALATKESGIKNIFALLGAALFALTSPALFRGNLGASAMSHFLIPWSLYLYLKLLRSPNFWSISTQFCLVGILSILLQPYFIIMVMPFFFAALLQKMLLKQVSLRNATSSFIYVLGMILVTAIFIGIVNNSSTRNSLDGFGFFSMNLVSPFLPPREHLPEFIARYFTWSPNGYSCEATGGQYEGYNYFGAGMLLLIVIHLFASRDFIWKAFKRHVVLLLVLIGLVLTALSNKIFFGNWLIFDIPMNATFKDLTGFFRASGRLFWPVYYVLAVGLVFLTFKRYKQRIAVTVTILALSLQLADTQVLRRNQANITRCGTPCQFQEVAWSSLLDKHQFFLQYPSFQSFYFSVRSLQEPHRTIQKLQLLWLAAKLGKPTNSVYLARPTRNWNDDVLEGGEFNILPGGLYLFGKSFPLALVEDHPNFKKWARESSFGVVCSRDWDKLPHLASSEEFKPITRSFAPTIQFGELLRFTNDGNALDCLLTGWSDPEPWGIWSLGKQSGLAFCLPRIPSGNICLTLGASPYIYPSRPVKEISLFVNDTLITTWNFQLGKPTEKQCANIPKEVCQLNNGKLMIKLVSKEVESPKQAGFSEDERLISLGLIDIMVTEEG